MVTVSLCGYIQEKWHSRSLLFAVWWRAVLMSQLDLAVYPGRSLINRCLLYGRSLMTECLLYSRSLMTECLLVVELVVYHRPSLTTTGIFLRSSFFGLKHTPYRYNSNRHGTLTNSGFHSGHLIWRDPQHQVVENYLYFFNVKPNIYKHWWLNSHITPDNSGLIGY